MSLQAIRDTLDALERLKPPPVDDLDGQRALRDQLVAALAPVGVTPDQAAPTITGDPTGEPVVVIAWAVDYDDALYLYAVPDRKVTAELAGALGDVHRCWANRMDCTPEGWAAAVWLMAALDSESMDVDAFHEAMVVDQELEDDEPGPERDALAAIYGSWSDTFVLGSGKFGPPARAGALDHPIRRVVVVNRAM